MKQVIAIIKPHQTDAVLRALYEAGFVDITIREVKGYGRQKSYLSKYEENEFSVVFLPKVEICVWADNQAAEAAINTIVKTARTGRMGDGKVMQLDVVAEHSSDLPSP